MRLGTEVGQVRHPCHPCNTQDINKMCFGGCEYLSQGKSTDLQASKCVLLPESLMP